MSLSQMWYQAYCAAVASGHHGDKAVTTANLALANFRERFPNVVLNK